ncbi:MAG TPA: NAD-dependent epimerase/dehydratase family protein [Anaerolineae bacterium]|nr:NAD-dependent epimerase/dehydratase family protein [Anaerolineae bacterium]HQH37097.1 NAD-dependent epimerase/dehydratase family protein [Anaerolineae bacterium]
MRVVVIGGTGHVGTYLVPRLVEAGHAVVVVSRGEREPYSAGGAWQAVQQVTLDRAAEERAGTFGQKVRALEPDAVIDMICFTLESAQHLVEALRGHVQHFLHCSTVWVHGYTTTVPVTEDAPRHPIGAYGVQKAAIEAYLHTEARSNGFPETCILPGHIVGPGWVPLNPQANFNPQVYAQLAHGEEVTLPNQGQELLHHVHADDVAQLFMKALANWNAAVGESFHAVSPAALTLRGYAEAVAAWFGQPAHLTFLPFVEWKMTVAEEDADATAGHLEHNPNCYSIVKSRRLLDYQPRYSSLQATYEAVQRLMADGVVRIKDS